MFIDDAHPGYGPPVPERNWFARHKILTGVGGFLALVIVFNALGDGDKDEVTLADAETSETAEPDATTPAPPPEMPPVESEAANQAPPDPAVPEEAPPVSEPASAFGPQPPDQVQFVGFVATAQQDARDSENDLQKGAVKATRDQAVCGLLQTKSVSGWTGTLTSIDANNDGKGVLDIEIAEDINIRTWGNAFSDIGDDTLIDPSSPVSDLRKYAVIVAPTCGNVIESSVANLLSSQLAYSRVTSRFFVHRVPVQMISIV